MLKAVVSCALPCDVGGLIYTAVKSRIGFSLGLTNQPSKANSALHPSGVNKWVPASAEKAKEGMVHSGTRGVQVKLWDPLRTRAIPERLRGVFTTSRYTNPRLPCLYLLYYIFKRLQRSCFNNIFVLRIAFICCTRSFARFIKPKQLSLDATPSPWSRPWPLITDLENLLSNAHSSDER